MRLVRPFAMQHNSATLQRKASHESELVTPGSYVKCREQRLHAAALNVDMEHSLGALQDERLQHRTGLLR